MNWYKIVTAIAKSFSQREFFKRLRKNWGVYQVSPGNHAEFKDPFGKSVWITFNNTGSEISPGVTEQILKKLDIPKDDFMMNKKRPKTVMPKGPESDELLETPKKETEIPDYQKQNWYQKQNPQVSI